MNTETRVVGRVAPIVLPLKIQRNHLNVITDVHCGSILMPPALKAAYAQFLRRGRNTMIWAPKPPTEHSIHPDTKLADCNRDWTVRQLMRQVQGDLRAREWRKATEAEERKLLKIEQRVYAWQIKATARTAELKARQQRKRIRDLGATMRRYGIHGVLAESASDLNLACRQYLEGARR